MKPHASTLELIILVGMTMTKGISLSDVTFRTLTVTDLGSSMRKYSTTIQYREPKWTAVSDKNCYFTHSNLFRWIWGFIVNSHKNSWIVSVTCASSYERNFPQSVCIGTFWCFDHGGFVDISSISPRIAQRHQKNTKLSTKQSETGYCCRQPGLGTKLKYI